jgi:hypothetical protein
MSEPGQIRFSGVQARAFEGVFDRETGRVRDLRLIDVNALQIQGDLSQRDLQRLQGELRDTTGADTTSTRERIATRADQTSTSDVRPPDQYTRYGRYTEATSDADLREGFSGDRVRAEQERLRDLGYDLGTTGPNGDGVDGFWGPKMQNAYEQYLSDTRNGTTRRTSDDEDSTSSSNPGIDSLRNQADGRIRYTDERPDRIANDLDRDFNRTNALGDPTPDVDNITETMTSMDNERTRQVDEELQRDGGASLRDRFEQMDDSPLGINDPFAIAGDNSDYIDFMQRNADARRNEGDDAAAETPVTDEYERTLLRARTDPNWGLWDGAGTDENSINHVFSRASGAQLTELDRRFREGVTQENGDVIKYEGGLREYIESEIGEGAHRDALLAQLDRPLR